MDAQRDPLDAVAGTAEMTATLTDEQWCVLDLLMRSREKGIPLNRLEMLNNTVFPQGMTVRLTWALLTMPETFVVWQDAHNVTLTDAGVEVYKMRFGKTPSTVADSVICLPGPGHYLN